MPIGSGLTRSAVPFTNRALEALRPSEFPYRVPDQRCIGLAVRVAPSGLKTWDLAYRVRGSTKVRRLSLGRVTDVGLEAARRRANELTSAARTGRDLIAEEVQARSIAASRLTVEKLIVLYMQRRVSGRLRTALDIERRLNRALSPILDRCANEVRRRDVRELLDAVADQGSKREAEKRRQTIGAMFRWALSQDIVEIDPTAGLTAYDSGTPRDRVLTASEIRLFWHWLEEANLPPEATAVLKLQILTGARCGEVSGMCAEEVDRETWTWTLPATRSKNKRSRTTPLASSAQQLVQERLSVTNAGPLFTVESGAPLTASHIGHHLLSRREKLPIGDFTSHDLRRTVATMLAEMGVALDLVAAVVGHEAGSRDTRTLVRHYVRTDLVDRKRAVLTAWDHRVQEIILAREYSGNIALLRS